jgi:4-amino-4-deoxy-L-arabinose transferase-like glycosyltransferase
LRFEEVQREMNARFGAVAFVSVVAAGVWWIAYVSSPQALIVVDAHDYAQMARQLARGEGWTSLQAFPYLLEWLPERGLSIEPPWPVVTRFPLPILVEAFAFRLLGERHLATVVFGGVYCVATAAVLFLLVRRLYGGRAGIFAALLVVALPASVVYSVSGLTQPGAAFFVAATALATTAAREHWPRSQWPGWVLGLLLGCAVLQRSNLGLLAIGVGASLLVGRPARRWGLLFTSGCVAALVAAPWWLRTLLHLRGPEVSLGPAPTRMFALGLGARDPFLHFGQPNGIGLIAENVGTLIARAASALDPTRWPEMFGWELTCAIPLLLLCAVVDRRERSAPVFALFGATFALNAALFAMTLPGPKYAQPFQPLAVALVAGRLFSFGHSRPGGSRRAPWIAAGCIALAFGVSAQSVGSRFAAESALVARHRPVFEAIEAHVAPGAVVASVASWQVAWAAARPSIRFKGGIAKLMRIDERVRIGAIHFDSDAARLFRGQLAKSPLGAMFREVPLPGGDRLWIRKVAVERGAAGSPLRDEGATSEGRAAPVHPR